MIPRLNLSEPTQQIYANFIKHLKHRPFSGEIKVDYGTRLLAATDNSIYQILPEVVLYPKNRDDIMELLCLANMEAYQKITFSPRGGGTGTNGQSLSTGIIVDCSKYMNRILEINVKEGWVRVEPGVVLDQLNDELKRHGVFFAPNLSPSNRATLGGMINTDACGQGSRVYGKTSNHILQLSCVLANGDFWESKPLEKSELKALKKRHDRVGQIHRQVDEIVTKKKSLIKKTFPQMSRFMTGYNLAKVYETPGQFNLNYILSGSEGTLAFVTEARLKLTPLPQYKQLVVVKYDSFEDALQAAEVLVETDPTAIETIDEHILDLAKGDEIYPKVKKWIQAEGEKPPRAINLVEFSGNEARLINQQVQTLCQSLETNKAFPKQAIGYSLAQKPEDITALWELRKKGVGLLGNTQGNRKPLPFVEDTAVPPKHLAAYIQEFRTLLDGYGLEYGMFGHVDVGCLHVRPALDLKDLNDEALIRELSDKVVALVLKYGGVMWAEHGKGFRSEYTPQFFGKELYQDLRRIKEAFDPANKLNPGKIASPFSMQDLVVSLESPLRGHFDRQILSGLQKSYHTALNCNGNGACFDYHPNTVMCPSSKITRDRLHSPKGRAGMLREWVRQLSLASQSPLVNKRWKITQGFFKIGNNLGKRRGVYDFSNEVYEAMMGCLACKACAAQCPIHVDVPDFRARFLERYHTRYLRPLKDYFVATVEHTGKWFSRIPRIANALLTFPLTQSLLSKIIGFTHAPLFSPLPMEQGLKMRGATRFDFNQLRNLSPQAKQNHVLLLQDAFTSFYETHVVFDVYDLLTLLGYQVLVPPFYPNGKPSHIKGFMTLFHKIAQKNASWLEQLGTLEIPMMGIDPSVVLTYRDEYPKVLGKPLNFQVHLLQEWLLTQEKQIQRLKIKAPSGSYKLLGHCMEKTGALASQEQWVALFKNFGIQLTLLPAGCCGMAGTYGHESIHVQESQGIYELSWKPHISNKENSRAYLLASGYSCRSQVARFEGFAPKHPLQALLNELRGLKA
ncbi:FAD-binding and (Fe-S)-binding domain-containing protein [Deltaproteobacteria bacterium TL4]